jgi:hypothetical protein
LYFAPFLLVSCLLILLGYLYEKWKWRPRKDRSEKP